VQTRLSRGCTDILFTFISTLQIGWGFENVTVFRNEEGRGCIHRAESAEHGDISRHWNFRFDAFNNNASYIFQGATSNISSDCRLRAYVCTRIRTRTRTRQPLRHTYAKTRRKPASVCWHLEHLPNAIRSRACTRDSDDTRIFVKFAAHPYYIIVTSQRRVDTILVLTWNRYCMTRFVSLSHLGCIKASEFIIQCHWRFISSSSKTWYNATLRHAILENSVVFLSCHDMLVSLTACLHASVRP